MALRVKYKDSYAPDIREVKDGERALVYSFCTLNYDNMFSVVGGGEEEFLGCIRGRRHVPGPYPGAMAFSGSW